MKSILIRVVKRFILKYLMDDFEKAVKDFGDKVVHSTGNTVTEKDVEDVKHLAKKSLKDLMDKHGIKL